MRLSAGRWERVVLGATLPAAAFPAKFSQRDVSACGSVSPAFQLKGVPLGTAWLDVTRRDRDAPDVRHGGPTVPYAGRGELSKAAAVSPMPCPPKGVVHQYIWTILALDAKGTDVDMTEAEIDGRR